MPPRPVRTQPTTYVSAAIPRHCPMSWEHSGEYQQNSPVPHGAHVPDRLANGRETPNSRTSACTCKHLGGLLGKATEATQTTGSPTLYMYISKHTLLMMLT